MGCHHLYIPLNHPPPPQRLLFEPLLSLVYFLFTVFLCEVTGKKESFHMTLLGHRERILTRSLTRVRHWKLALCQKHVIKKKLLFASVDWEGQYRCFRRVHNSELVHGEYPFEYPHTWCNNIHSLHYVIWTSGSHIMGSWLNLHSIRTRKWK